MLTKLTLFSCIRYVTRLSIALCFNIWTAPGFGPAASHTRYGKMEQPFSKEILEEKSLLKDVIFPEYRADYHERKGG